MKKFIALMVVSSVLWVLPTAFAQGDAPWIRIFSSQPTTAFQTDYEAIERAAQSVFLLEVYDENHQLLATGSGFVAFDSGTLITNEHVIEDAAYMIAYSDQYRASYKLYHLKAVDPNMDIAIVAFDPAARITPLQVDTYSRLFRGQPVTAIGSPQGILNTVSSGNISNIVLYSEEIPDCIQFTAPISPGSSGGALFNEQGAVIGLCVSFLKEAEAVYYAIPMKYVENVYQKAQHKEMLTLAQYNKLPSHLPAARLQKAKLGDESIELQWSAVDQAEGYALYRREGKEMEFSLLATLQGTSYSDADVVVGQTYEYYVQAVHSWCSSDASDVISFTMIEPTPTPKPTQTPKPTPTPKPTAEPVPQGKILYEVGSTNEAILEIKCILAEYGYYSIHSTFNTKFDRILISAIRAFQKENGLTVTGVIDETTLEWLYAQNKRYGDYTFISREIKAYSKREYRIGEKSSEIVRLKKQLQKLGYYKPEASLSNIYNDTMAERVEQFQKNNHLQQTGTIDYVTLLEMYYNNNRKGKYALPLVYQILQDAQNRR